MRWLTEWHALSGRIEGLVAAVSFYTATLENFGRRDHVGTVAASLLPELDAITSALQIYRRDYANDLPDEAAEVLDDFVNREWPTDFNLGRLQAISSLVVLRSRFLYSLRSGEAEAISLVELAFEHLRRLILVDEDAQRQWRDAFQRGEVRCEHVGAVHLLRHGVWAFKVAGERAVTDLVLAEPAPKTALTLSVSRTTSERAPTARADVVSVRP